MTDAVWCIEIERREMGDESGPLYGCTVSVQQRTQYCDSETCRHYAPAYSKEAAVTTVRAILEDIRCGRWKKPEKPDPAPDNTELQDTTGLFSMDDFFDSGTLTAFMAETAAE